MSFPTYTDDRAILSELINAHIVNPNHEELFEVGIKVGKLYSDHGLPIDMALEKIKLVKEAKVMVLHGALWWLVEHKRNSNATDKALDRQRKANRETMRRFFSTGETGVY